MWTDPGLELQGAKPLSPSHILQRSGYSVLKAERWLERGPDGGKLIFTQCPPFPIHQAKLIFSMVLQACPRPYFTDESVCTMLSKCYLIDKSFVNSHYGYVYLLLKYRCPMKSCKHDRRIQNKKWGGKCPFPQNPPFSSSRPPQKQPDFGSWCILPECLGL